MRQLSLRKFLLGDHNTDTIESMIRAADAQDRCGDLGHAQSLGEHAIRNHRNYRLIAKGDSDGPGGSSIILTEHGQLREAEKCHSEALKIRQDC
jgi:hypothetical protein